MTGWYFLSKEALLFASGRHPVCYYNYGRMRTENIELSLGIEDYMAERYQIDYVEGELVYSCVELGGYLYETKYFLTPNKEAWKTFWSFMKKCKWQPVYSDPKRYSGTDWFVHLKYGDFVLDVEGANAFPPDFEVFQDLVKKLVAGRNFG